MSQRALAILTPIINGLIVVAVLALASVYHRPSSEPRTYGWVRTLSPYCRRIIYSVAILVATAIYIWGATHYPTMSATAEYLMRAYAYAGLVSLLLVFIPGLVRVLFPASPFKGLLLQSRRALGQSAFGFIVLHSVVAFYNNLSGSLGSLGYLTRRSQWAMAAAVLALVILLLLFVTSHDRIEQWMGKWWKRLHRFVYLAAIVIVVHVLLIGSSFVTWSSAPAVILTSGALILLWLEIAATLVEIRRRGNAGRRGWQALAVVLVLVALAAPVVQYRLMMQPPYDPHAHGDQP